MTFEIFLPHSLNRLSDELVIILSIIAQHNRRQPLALGVPGLG